MRALLLGIATLAVILPAPSVAQSASGISFSGGSSGGHNFHRGHGSRFNGDFDRRDGRRHHGDNDGAFYFDYYHEYQGDTAWKSDSFNDWWHDRPDRAYPRWMTNNQNCERHWFAGDMLRC